MLLILLPLLPLAKATQDAEADQGIASAIAGASPPPPPPPSRPVAADADGANDDFRQSRPKTSRLLRFLVALAWIAVVLFFCLAFIDDWFAVLALAGGASLVVKVLVAMFRPHNPGS